jgi:integrase
MLKDTEIKNLKFKELEYQELVYPNLYIVVHPKTKTNPKGRKTWLGRAKHNKKQHQKTFGDYYQNPNILGHVSFAKAVAEAIDFKAEVALGLKKKEKDQKVLLSAYPAKYAYYKGRDVGESEMVRVRTDVDRFIKIIKSDREPHEYSKKDVNAYIMARLKTIEKKKGTLIKTGTVERELNSIRGSINLVNEQEEIDHPHRFNKPNIPKKGKDRKKKSNFSFEQLETLRTLFADTNRKTELIAGLQVDTGLRIGEVVGLAVEDIVVIDKKIAFVVIRENTLEREETVTNTSIKTPSSERFVPLVGISLECAKTLKKMCERSLNPERKWVFPSYLKPKKSMAKANKGEILKDDKGKVIMEFKGDYASKAVNERLKAILGEESPTSHSFRHTIQTRLRNVECPEWMRDELGGWAKTTSERYGTPTDIEIKTNYLKKSISVKLDSALDSLI